MSTITETGLDGALEYDTDVQRLTYTERLSPDEMGATEIVAYNVAPWFGLRVVAAFEALDAALAPAPSDSLDAAAFLDALSSPPRYQNDANGNWWTTDMEYGWEMAIEAVRAALSTDAEAAKPESAE